MSAGEKSSTAGTAVRDDSLTDALDAALKATKKMPLEQTVEEAEVKHSADERSQRSLAERLSLPFIRLHDYPFDETVLSLIPAEFARNHDVIPLRVNKTHLLVALASPMDMDLFQTLNFITGYSIDVTVATRADVQWAVRKFYGARDDELALESLNGRAHPLKDAADLHDEMMRLSSEKPIVRLVANIIVDAIERRASDIHIKPRDKNVELIYRMDGVLTNIRFFSKTLLAAVVSRIKILGGMNIAERRLPQDGRCCVKHKNNPVDLRISIMPTVEGESVVIRLLNAQVGLKAVSELGFSDHDQTIFLDLLNKSNGIFLVTGPTGSGKSTTLYAALAEVQKQNVNILTVEDPVEYHMDGIQQIQINHTTGYTFARALRNILRHDPDVILVGEIRDEETGKIAVESALTGHLVLSTLHTNDAAGAVTRLLEMGIEPYLLTGCLLGVLAQRLVKRNCRHCLEKEPVDPLIRHALNVSDDEPFYRGRGCEHCNHTGVAGRMAVYELLEVSDSLRKFIHVDITSGEIHEQAVKEGMVSLTDNAMTRARSREISLGEVYRVRLD
ncbi:GspE/PulE family protein [Methylophaga sp.]|jgi:type IV pilus assembly protein PilB|uniref:GspE/PulE family protein n=1 Tax=Methylophaga sp. TaxID=2024840 RepID=UPI001400476C|nr:GspE/PulE family protein [Methylophaga sp.]MTI62307.1 type II/IV secretion system protein [Methylophaga sp.]